VAQCIYAALGWLVVIRVSRRFDPGPADAAPDGALADAAMEI